VSLLEELAELEHEDPEYVPEILPVDARLSLRGPVARFIELFERAASVSPKKEIIPGTGYSLIEGFAADSSATSYVKISATDGEQTISVVVEGIKVAMAGAVLVPAQKILEILKRTPTDSVKLEVLGNSATLRSGRAQWTVQTPTGDSLPPTPDISDIELHSVGRKPLLRGLEVARKAVAGTAARPALMQAQVRDGAITAADGGRVHRQRVDGLTDELDFAIPVRVMDELMSALRASDAEKIELGASDYHLVFQIDQDSLIAQRLLIPFPDVDPLLLGPAFSNQNSLGVDSNQLAEVVKRVRVNADPDYSGIYLVLVPGQKDTEGTLMWSLAVRARDRIGNSAQELMECRWIGSSKPREVCVNHRYLSDLLTSYNQDDAIFRLGEDTKSVKNPLFIEDTALGFSGIVQQMRGEFFS
jgi:DNA polymerase III sliding clamp (beta) subunit (PCNA family)